MRERTKMICPVCGAEMNRHAEKVDYSAPGAFDPDFGGVLMEFHTCPRCGFIVERPAE
jgi:C4-type Zn-finger protein